MGISTLCPVFESSAPRTPHFCGTKAKRKLLLGLGSKNKQTNPFPEPARRVWSNSLCNRPFFQNQNTVGADMIDRPCVSNPIQKVPQCLFNFGFRNARYLHR